MTLTSLHSQVQNSINAETYLSRTAAAAPEKTPAATEPPPPPPSRPFVSPLAGAAPRRPGGGPVQPRFDPRTPGALVMPRPSAQYQVNRRYNRDCGLHVLGRDAFKVIM